MPRYYQGYFKAKHPEKYAGDPTQIVYRSRWELKAMSHFDEHPDVLRWASEEIYVRYISPVDNDVHRYFPDFLVKRRSPDGKVKTIMVEVKPLKQTQPPKPPKRKTKAYVTEVMTWGINSAKWKAAREYCEDRGWEFAIVTEQDLFT